MEISVALRAGWLARVSARHLSFARVAWLAASQLSASWLPLPALDRWMFFNQVLFLSGLALFWLRWAPRVSHVPAASRPELSLMMNNAHSSAARQHHALGAAKWPAAASLTASERQSSRAPDLMPASQVGESNSHPASQSVSQPVRLAAQRPPSAGADNSAASQAARPDFCAKRGATGRCKVHSGAHRIAQPAARRWRLFLLRCVLFCCCCCFVAAH